MYMYITSIVSDNKINYYVIGMYKKPKLNILQIE